MKTSIIIIILSFLALICPKMSLAVENNKFGIHILEVSDTEKATELVNSSGGDWGWVTMVIREDDMNYDKWQNFFNDCREKHLIPIIRIATKLDKYNWQKPKEKQAIMWADFLFKLNWPVKEKYVTIFNEPNHAKEWGGELNPAQYARILNKFIDEIKKKDENFKLLNAGLDLAAPNGLGTMEAFNYLGQMEKEVPGIFEKLDGWSSHSYANHGFKGKPAEYKKTSIRGYEFELEYLKKLGVKKELPVFITETGWPKSEPYFVKKYINKKTQLVKINGPYYNKETVAEYIKYSFENIWLKDNKVIAVTPFVLNYPADLFYAFSWIDKDKNPYPQFNEVKNIVKIKGTPEQENSFEILSVIIPPFLPPDTEYQGVINIKNTGQTIWGESTKTLAKGNESNGLITSDLFIEENKKIIPFESSVVNFTLKSKNSGGKFSIIWNNKEVGQIKVYPKSILTSIQYNFWEKVTKQLKTMFIGK